MKFYNNTLSIFRENILSFIVQRALVVKKRAMPSYSKFTTPEFRTFISRRINQYVMLASLFSGLLIFSFYRFVLGSTQQGNGQGLNNVRASFAYKAPKELLIRTQGNVFRQEGRTPNQFDLGIGKDGVKIPIEHRSITPGYSPLVIDGKRGIVLTRFYQVLLDNLNLQTANLIDEAVTTVVKVLPSMKGNSGIASKVQYGDTNYLGKLTVHKDPLLNPTTQTSWSKWSQLRQCRT